MPPPSIEVEEPSMPVKVAADEATPSNDAADTNAAALEPPEQEPTVEVTKPGQHPASPDSTRRTPQAGAEAVRRR